MGDVSMIIRLALDTDEDEIVAMARANIEETCPDMRFNEARCRATFRAYLDTAQPTIWVAEQRRQVVGFLLAGMYNYRAADGLFTVQEVLYVKPANRGSRAATRLLKRFVEWSRSLGAHEAAGGIDNAFQPERTARFFELHGFERVGFAMRQVLDDNGEEKPGR